MPAPRKSTEERELSPSGMLPLSLKLPPELIDELDAWVEEARDAQIGGSGISRNSIIRDILTRAVKEHRAQRAAPTAQAPKAATSRSPLKKRPR